ncbi:MAG: hypothetical protein LUD82_03990 [Clostridiales bacterium]|nr:hypothetical protein [Clostridiales bacterium]MCD8126652.1 hypothetical protein [Clostridiales bacterium]
MKENEKISPSNTQGNPAPEQPSDALQHKQRPGIEANVWSRFDDDGYGIYNVQPPTSHEETDEKESE